MSKYFVNYCQTCLSTVLVSEEVEKHPWANGYENSDIVSMCPCCEKPTRWWVTRTAVQSDPAHLTPPGHGNVLDFRDVDPAISVILSDDDTIVGDKKVDRFAYIVSLTVFDSIVGGL